MKEGEKPLILIGQDECIFKKYLFTNSQWALPGGQTAIIPKDNGHGMMISAFVSHEFGYSINLTSAQLDQVNDFCKHKDYVDEDAAIEINNTKRKPKLTKSPFIRQFQYGMNNDGYLNYSTMVL